MTNKFRINNEDLKKVLVGGAIAVGGALATYLQGLTLDFGSYTPLAVAINSIIINLLRKFVAKTK